MNIPFMNRIVDERFLNHRLRSSSLAGIVGGVLAIVLFEYQLLKHHVWNWSLFAVAVTIVGVKLGAVLWYRLTD
jgi:hypothetical protein